MNLNESKGAAASTPASPAANPEAPAPDTRCEPGFDPVLGDPPLLAGYATSPKVSAPAWGAASAGPAPSASAVASPASPVVNAHTAALGTPTWERATLEKLAFATLSEQTHARRWKNFFRLAWLGLVIAILYLAFRTSGPGMHTNSPSEHTAVIDIKGEISSGAEASAEYLGPALRAAFEEGSAKGIVLRINSPGGSPVQAGVIYDEIKRLKALHNKPVIAVVEESAASAAYYIAVSADTIVVNKASIVGSIGVLMDGFGFTGLMDKLGVERRLMTAGENKGFLDPFSPQTDKQRAYSQAMLDQIHKQFIATVKEGRGPRLKEGPDTFSGLFWVGQQAIDLGLADSLGTVESVARDTFKAEDTIDYTRRENVAEKLAKRFGASIGEGAVKAMGQRALQVR